MGDQLRQEVETQFLRVANRHPVRTLPEYVGEEGLADLTQQFHLHLIQGRLDELFAHAADLEHLQLLLRVRARQFLSNQRRRLDLDNVRRRALEILESDVSAFAHFEDAGARCWHAADRPGLERFSGDLSELRRFAWSLRIPPSTRRFRQDTQIAPRLLSDSDLRVLLREMCKLSPWSLTATDVVHVLRERLGAWPVETMSLSRELAPGVTIEELRGQLDPGFEAVEMRMLAEDVRALLSMRQLIVLGCRYGERRTRDQVAKMLGVGHGTVDSEANRAAAVILGVANGDYRLAGAVLAELLARWNAL